MSEVSGESAVIDLTKQEEKDVESHVPQRSPVIFEIIRRMGEEELNRPWISLWWSGIAAGISMGMSVLAEALLHDGLKGVPLTEMIEKLGYSLGFIIVILARQQLFTENTLASVVPVMAHFHFQNLKKIARLWGTVLIANVIGTIVFAFFLIHGSIVSSSVLQTVTELSLQPFSFGFGELICRGAVSGFLIASLVWILANTEGSKVGIIVLLTYPIALGNFAHIIAGSVEASFLVMTGSVSVEHAVFGFYLPTLIGNVLGGTFLFAMLAYGQTHSEFMRDEKEHDDSLSSS